MSPAPHHPRDERGAKPAQPLEAGIEELLHVMARVRGSIQKVIEGKPFPINMALTVLLAEGHLLVEDVPGVGKTMLAKALGKSIDVRVNRIQFTPDLLPSDITGVSVFNQQLQDFEFKPGGIFANIVLGDEINRASPKTQSAMLESMEELQVSVDGITHHMQSPFMVIATQNPIEMEGTYPLPEAQRDRFMAKITMGYPSMNAELEMLDSHGQRDPIADLTSVADGALINRMISICKEIYVAPTLKTYLLDLIRATRADSELRLGASPRASLQLLRAARAHAALNGRTYVNPEDIRELAVPVLAHRILPSAESQLRRRDLPDVVEGIVRATRVPGER